MPQEIVGSEFLRLHKTHDDPVTKISPDATYSVVGLGEHLFRGKPVSPYRELADMANVSA